MRIVVCMKQVYDPKTVKISRSREEFDLREAVKITNPPDKLALEMALRLREANGGEVIALTAGEAQAEDVVREAIAIGADRGLLIADPGLATAGRPGRGEKPSRGHQPSERRRSGADGAGGAHGRRGQPGAAAGRRARLAGRARCCRGDARVSLASLRQPWRRMMARGSCRWRPLPWSPSHPAPRRSARAIHTRRASPMPGSRAWSRSARRASWASTQRRSRPMSSRAASSCRLSGHAARSSAVRFRKRRSSWWACCG